MMIGKQEKQGQTRSDKKNRTNMSATVKTLLVSLFRLFRTVFAH